LRAGVAVLALAYVGYQAASLLVGASGLRVASIVVRGNTRLSTGEVLGIVAGLRGQSILLADLGAYRSRLRTSPWVRDASLRRLLPSTVEIAVVERAPIGVGRIGGRVYLVDASGVVIDEYGPQYADFDLPVIDGLAAGGTRVGPVDAPRAALAARLVRAVAGHPDLAKRVSQVDVTDVQDAVVVLDDDPALLHLGQERFAERLQSYVELAPTLRERVPDIDYVDLRFEGRVYVRPSGGARGKPAARRF
jgi:cell division septal protein FtsQ